MSFRRNLKTVLFWSSFKPGFHYPSSRPEFTGRVDGPSTLVHFLTPVNSARVHGCQKMHPSARAVNFGSGNRALELLYEVLMKLHSICGHVYLGSHTHTHTPGLTHTSSSHHNTPLSYLSIVPSGFCHSYIFVLLYSPLTSTWPHLNSDVCLKEGEY